MSSSSNSSSDEVEALNNMMELGSSSSSRPSSGSSSSSDEVEAFNNMMELGGSSSSSSGAVPGSLLLFPQAWCGHLTALSLDW